PAPEHADRIRRARRVARRADDLAARLRVLGLRNDAAAAELVGLRAAIAAGAVPGRPPGRRQAGTLPPISKTAPLDLRMLRTLTAAELAIAHGDPARALVTLRSGLAVLARHRSRLGSVDLQTGTAALGVELAAAGLTLTVDRPRQAFAWSELSRAQALRIRPVRPPTDPGVAQAVAEIRSLEFSRREAVFSGASADLARAGRQAALEQRIRRSAWRAAGSGAAEGVAAFDDVAETLGRQDTALVSLFKNADTLFALVVAGTDCRVVPLGAAEGVYETARRLRADLVALVGRVLPARMEKALAQAVAAHAESLDTVLFRSRVRGLVGDRELVVVPCGPLAATPWSLLPALRGRALSVAPSATSWLAAVRARSATPMDRDGSRGTVLVAGPGLRQTGRELRAVASSYQDPVVLDGADAAVEATLAALDGARTAHLAVHGHHDPENPLFSKLELADGPLMAYDLLHLDAVPEHVVLSACDVGRISMRPGDEPLGLVATLLHAGSRTVVAAAAPVADGVAAEVMGEYHRLLRAGRRPAAALAAATQANPLAAFSCFGAG
ncbi:CHAT domain-containing protein, partial [Catenulispora rubra]|uniref:CHAT domain-containing protein n=1 Tax=Catenulispora rubra TaxID=280293 RepID=UPI001E364D30